MEIWRSQALLYYHIGDLDQTSKRARNFLPAYYFHKATTRRCKTTGFEQAQDSFKIEGFFQKNDTSFFYKVRDGCRSLLNDASKVS